MSWLDDVTLEIAETSGVDIALLRLTTDEISDLLDVARIASHTSGERINAPLLCYVLGVARAHSASFEELIETIQKRSG
ncbi:MAG: hypothetical protein LC663_05695 [Actinobacteria bacterium]|nr:hypothetical protein [Actinomycetota bacterium]